jgi:transforming growth factor-beta-induced protein
MSESSQVVENKLNLIETIAKDDKFSTFSRLMGTSKANEIFSADGDFTVFAPTNDAFGKIPDAKMNALLNETDQAGLRALLSYHVLPGIFTAANISGLKSTPTVTGVEVTFSDTNGLKVNGSGVQARNIQARDGIVHAIDTVLTPPASATAGN